MGSNASDLSRNIERGAQGPERLGTITSCHDFIMGSPGGLALSQSNLFITLQSGWLGRKRKKVASESSDDSHAHASTAIPRVDTVR